MGPARGERDAHLRRMTLHGSYREPCVWADDATPFTGPEVMVLLRENETLQTRVANAESARNRWLIVLQRRIRQHSDNLEMWAEPSGFLCPTEPDPGERRRIRIELLVAIGELTRLAEEVGVKL